MPKGLIKPPGLSPSPFATKQHAQKKTEGQEPADTASVGFVTRCRLDNHKGSFWGCGVGGSRAGRLVREADPQLPALDSTGECNGCDWTRPRRSPRPRPGFSGLVRSPAFLSFHGASRASTRNTVFPEFREKPKKRASVGCRGPSDPTCGAQTAIARSRRNRNAHSCAPDP